MRAVIYQSNTGFTKEYALMLSNLLSLPAIPFSQARKKLSKGDTIIYMGWVMGGSIKNLEKARRFFSIPVVCGVGMTFPTEDVVKDLRARHHYGKYDLTALFYLQGGCDTTRLKGLHKTMITMVKTSLQKNIADNAPTKEEDALMLDILEHNKSCVKEENLLPVIDFIKNMVR